VKFVNLIDYEALETQFDHICEPITEITDEVVKFCHNLAQVMYDYDGIGVSAPQVGINKRIIIIDCSENKNETIYLINPEILWQSPKESQKKEGCLSYPGLVLPISRPQRIKVQGLDLNGKIIEFEATGLYARCIYHEIDHLNGISFTRRATRQVRRHLMRKWLKKHKNEQ
jgi:peptide deformylase